MEDILFPEVLGRITDISARLAALEARVKAVEARLDHELASRNWVNETLQSVRAGAMATEHAIRDLARIVNELTGDTRALYAAHDQLLRERACREREEHVARLQAAQDNTLWNLLQRYWIPLTAAIAGTSATLTIVGNWAQVYFTQLLRHP